MRPISSYFLRSKADGKIIQEQDRDEENNSSSLIDKRKADFKKISWVYLYPSYSSPFIRNRQGISDFDGISLI